MATRTAAAMLGAELRRLRLERGLSQREFVRMLGLTAHSNLVQYELGRRIPPGDIVAAYERLFGEAASALRGLCGRVLAERAGKPRPDAHPAGPAMLPAAIGDFTGRAAELHRLADLAAPSGVTAPSDAVTIVAITGTAGVGKTALAVHFAHRIRDRFPDGQLHVNLRGYAPAPALQPVQALAALLPALGVRADRIPTDLAEAVGLYRSLLADRRVLVVLDNAHGAAQVRPLIPAGPGSLALVTSRDRLTGLAAHDSARRLTLDVLPPDESHRLLCAVLGPGRAQAEPDAATDLAGACAHLPLALRIAAASLNNHSGQTIAGYLAELRADPLAAFEADGDEDTAVRATFNRSYRALAPDARRMFRLLGLVPGVDVTAGAAAALAETTPAGARRLLDLLAAGHLAIEPAPARYTCHDLLRLFATERCRAEDARPVRAAALRRLLDWYLHIVDAAARLLYPEAVRLPVPAVRPDPPSTFDDHAAASAWIDAERPNLVAAVRHAAAHGPRRSAWLLADALRFYFILRMHAVDWLAVAEAGLAAAVAEHDEQATAALELSLADHHLVRSRHAEAAEHYQRAQHLARRTGWARGLHAALGNCGMVYWRSGRLPEAIECYTRSLELDRASGDLLGQAVCLGNLGTMRRELREAAGHYEQALQLYRRLGSPRGVCTSHSNLGQVYADLGRLDEAASQLTDALAIMREIGDRPGEANAVCTLAAVHRDAGCHDQALESARIAVLLARDTGERRTGANALNVLGSVHERMGDRREAVELHTQALHMAREAGERSPEIEALLGLAAAHDDADQALAHAREAHTATRDGGYRALEGHALNRLAAIHATLGRTASAVDLARQAIAIHHATGHHLGEARARALLASVAVPQAGA